MGSEVSTESEREMEESSLLPHSSVDCHPAASRTQPCLSVPCTQVAIHPCCFWTWGSVGARVYFALDVGCMAMTLARTGVIVCLYLCWLDVPVLGHPDVQRATCVHTAHSNDGVCSLPVWTVMRFKPYHFTMMKLGRMSRNSSSSSTFNLYTHHLWSGAVPNDARTDTCCAYIWTYVSPTTSFSSWGISDSSASSCCSRTPAGTPIRHEWRSVQGREKESRHLSVRDPPRPDTSVARQSLLTSKFFS